MTLGPVDAGDGMRAEVPADRSAADVPRDLPPLDRGGDARPPPSDKPTSDKSTSDKRPTDKSKSLDVALPPLKANGSACSQDGDCTSGICWSTPFETGCCNRYCGPCETCKSGICTNLTAGSAAANNSCTFVAGDPCKTSMCDGAGKCSSQGMPGLTCGSASCDAADPRGATLDIGGVCDAAGTCVHATPIACSSYRCSTFMGSSFCENMCTGPAACTSDAVCTSHTCNGESRPLGSPCSFAGDCQSKHCVEGTCCESSCSSPCQTCKVYGRCVPVQYAWAPPTGKSCPTGGGACGAVNLCDGLGQCLSAAPKGTACNSGCTTVTSGDQVVHGTCDGSGSCVDTVYPCGNYRCQPGGLASCYGRCRSGLNACKNGCACQPTGYCTCP